jgi:hypothetical protein
MLVVAQQKSFNCIEGCYAAISVKSFLNKDELKDALENLESIPTDKKIIVNPYITNRQRLIDQIPQRIIFAYNGNSCQTIQGHLEDYYSTHSSSFWSCMNPKTMFFAPNTVFTFCKSVYA